jgi:hypothetical protein
VREVPVPVGKERTKGEKRGREKSKKWWAHEAAQVPTVMTFCGV